MKWWSKSSKRSISFAPNYPQIDGVSHLDLFVRSSSGADGFYTKKEFIHCEQVESNAPSSMIDNTDGKKESSDASSCEEEVESDAPWSMIDKKDERRSKSSEEVRSRE